uniref:ATPase subunit 4 n=1 Tax=Dictyostelium intermedium TaxID=361076 RepID=UPI001D0FE90D|nr:ATPase subunit 4 [Dictyostelium intermedium]DAZ85387.1 TPA_asm: ATPase subunit 4 [Dictyostelium intermedium]
MIVKIILGLILIIGLIAKEEIALNEELVISISFIITIMVIKTMIKDSANEAFKSRGETQEQEFLTDGGKSLHKNVQKLNYEGSVIAVRKANNSFSNKETIKFAKEGMGHQTIRSKLYSFLSGNINNYSISYITGCLGGHPLNVV